jgi:hypothetical protein
MKFQSIGLDRLEIWLESPTELTVSTLDYGVIRASVVREYTLRISISLPPGSPSSGFVVLLAVSIYTVVSQASLSL